MFPLKLGSEASKFSYKIPIRYEDINKIQTEFSPSGKFPRSGMHNVSLQTVLIKTLLFGICSVYRHTKTQILNATIENILTTKRFDESLFHF